MRWLMICFAGFISAAWGQGSSQTEDLDTLKKMYGDKIAIANERLDQALALKPIQYEVGAEISLEDCRKIQAKVSENHPLHTYLDSEYHFQKGLLICPEILKKDGNYYFEDSIARRDSLKIYRSERRVQNSVGVIGHMVLTLRYESVHRPVVHERQFIFAENFRFIQYRRKWVNRLGEAYSVLSVLTDKGDVLARTDRKWANPKQPHALKTLVTYVSALGDLSPATRSLRTDGHGRPFEQRTYVQPYQSTWELFDLSPKTWNGGIYKTESKTSAFIDTITNLLLYSNSERDCGYGYVGFDAKGKMYRFFGNLNCANEMDF